MFEKKCCSVPWRCSLPPWRLGEWSYIKSLHLQINCCSASGNLSALFAAIFQFKRWVPVLPCFEDIRDSNSSSKTSQCFMFQQLLAHGPVVASGGTEGGRQRYFCLLHQPCSWFFMIKPPSFSVTSSFITSGCLKGFKDSKPWYILIVPLTSWNDFFLLYQTALKHHLAILASLHSPPGWCRGPSSHSSPSHICHSL